jgi:hypothetical protein
VPYYLPDLVLSPADLKQQVVGDRSVAEWLLEQYTALAGQQQYSFLEVDQALPSVAVNIPALRGQVLGMAHAALLREQAQDVAAATALPATAAAAATTPAAAAATTPAAAAATTPAAAAAAAGALTGSIRAAELEGQLPSQVLRAFLDSTQDPQALLDAGPVFAALASLVAATLRRLGAAGGGSSSAGEEEQLAAAAAGCPVPGVTSPLEVVDFCLAFERMLWPGVSCMGTCCMGSICILPVPCR